MFIKHMAGPFRDEVDLVGFCDINPYRARLVNEEFGLNIPVFTDFDEMIAACKPDVVLVTTIDSFHHEYIIRALEAGCDAITEKPMTIDAEKCKAILAAEKRTGKKTTVTFNCRFMPYVAKIKELLMAGTIGKVHSIHMECSLNLSHGASYFRRWHRHMSNSSGLLVHKSTHQFDMINWWLDDEPESVFAFGDLRYYGPNRDKRGVRCQTCEHSQSCEFYTDATANEKTNRFYMDAAKYDGYYVDQCVFGDTIDIYDTMSVNVRYTRGTQLSFSLTAYSPIEGWKAVFVGDQGRMEAASFHGTDAKMDHNEEILLYNRKGELTLSKAEKGIGSHGGGDVLLRKMLFSEGVPDPLGQMAASRAGAMSLLIGAGANQSIRTKQLVRIEELLR